MELATNGSSIDGCFISGQDSAMFKVVSAIRAVSAIVSLVGSASIIFIIIAHKKYKFFPQRLILCLAITVVLHSVSNALGVADFEEGRNLANDHFCRYIGGFFDLYTGWIELIAVFCIAASVFCNTILCLDLNNVKFTPFLITFLIPLIWCWIPYTLSAFGIEGPWCGISVHTEMCIFSVEGNWLRFGLWEIPIFTIFLLGFTVIIIASVVKVQRKRKEWEGLRYDPVKEEAKKKLLRSIFCLLCFPFLYLLLLTPRLIGDIYQAVNSDKISIVLWVLEALLTPLAGGVVLIASAFTVDSPTMKKFKERNVCGLCAGCVRHYCKKWLHRREFEETVRSCALETEDRYGDSLSGIAMRNSMYELYHVQRMQKNGAPRQANDTLDDIL